jgi:phospholipase C
MMPAFLDLRTPAALNKTQTMDHFFADLKTGGLAQYTLLQPTMATSKTQVSNWQHPDNSVAAGEALIEEVYTALRASPYWDDALLILT